MSTWTERKVDFSILVRANPERVYDALTTAQGLDGWFTKGAAVDASPGGFIHFKWKEHGVDKYEGENGGPVLEANRPSRFVFQWKVDVGSYNSTVEIDFKPVTEGTVVRLIEHGYHDTPEGLQDFINRTTGWAEALTMMKFFVEHRVTY
jgi:uncharacterized protein YndB with AHSA1/START domain